MVFQYYLYRVYVYGYKGNFVYRKCLERKDHCLCVFVLREPEREGVGSEQLCS